MAIIVLEWCLGLNHHGSKAWVTASALHCVALSIMLHVAVLGIVLLKHPGDSNSASSHSGTSGTLIWEMGRRNKTQIVSLDPQGYGNGP